MLPGVRKEAVIDINLCDANKILHVFEEIGNFIGSNVNWVDHQVQQAFIIGVHYDWVAAEPRNPWEKMLTAVRRQRLPTRR